MKDNNPDQAVNFERELQFWYRIQAQENPSAELDEAIIKQAKNSAPKIMTDDLIVISSPFWRRHRWMLSSAASVMFVGTLFLINQDMTQEILSDAPTLMQMRAPQSVSQGHANAALMQVSSDVQDQKIPSISRVASTQTRSIKRDPIDAGGQKKSERSYSTTRSKMMHVEVNETVGNEVSTTPFSDDLKAKIESLSDNLDIKSQSQREVVVSAKQALNHLENLVITEQWTAAEKLLLKIRKIHPELRHKEHHQYLRWKTLSEQILIPLPNANELIPNK